MNISPQSPWASGPGEILRHGLFLLEEDTDTNRRLAMIAIDNAVELMIKTYLGLPGRITGLSLTRKEYQDMAENFPALLDGLEKYASEKLDGIDLGTIEWYHRLRNELYHQGNGLTVERDKVEIYSELANLLFKNLFGENLIAPANPEAELLGKFMTSWVLLESGILELADRHSLLGNISQHGLIEAIRFLQGADILDTLMVDELNELRSIRNEIVHGKTDYRFVLSPHIIDRVTKYAELLGEE